MPAWGQFILGFAAVAGAIVYLWQKVLKPGARMVASLDRLLPVAQELAEEFHDAPEALRTLREIARQFKPNNGSSLRDVTNRLERKIDDLADKIDAAEANR